MRNEREVITMEPTSGTGSGHSFTARSTVQHYHFFDVLHSDPELLPELLLDHANLACPWGREFYVVIHAEFLRCAVAKEHEDCNGGPRKISFVLVEGEGRPSILFACVVFEHIKLAVVRVPDAMESLGGPAIELHEQKAHR